MKTPVPNTLATRTLERVFLLRIDSVFVQIAGADHWCLAR